MRRSLVDTFVVDIEVVVAELGMGFVETVVLEFVLLHMDFVEIVVLEFAVLHRDFVEIVALEFVVLHMDFEDIRNLDVCHMDFAEIVVLEFVALHMDFVHIVALVLHIVLYIFVLVPAPEGKMVVVGKAVDYYRTYLFLLHDDAYHLVYGRTRKYVMKNAGVLQ